MDCRLQFIVIDETQQRYLSLTPACSPPFLPVSRQKLVRLITPLVAARGV
jgi:hypothetical protein